MWVDLLADEILKTRPEARHVVNDAKSPSGRIHLGSLRGVILHDCVRKALRDRGVPVEFLYGYDDYDPFDAVPVGHEDLAPHLGRPLCEVPSPDPAAAPNFARFYADEFTRVFTRLGATPKIYWGSEMYRSGAFDGAIGIALDRGAEIMELDRAISGSRKAERHPVQVICESCGKIVTTVVTGWDGENVAYGCRPDKVPWAQGCGHTGRRSPFGGASKLSYSTEWAAKWRILGVTVEGAGKDHMTRGGSWDRAAAIAEGIYGYPRPFAIPYEFFLVGGRRMTSSKGIGTPAAEFAELMRPELARFAIVRPHYRQAVNFDPGGETIPALYDEFDRAAAAFAGRESDPDLARTFYYSNPAPHAEQVFRPRFTHLAHLSQIPSADVAAEVAREKGAPLTDADRAELALRLADARKWLEAYAPPAHRFEVQVTLPDAVSDLSEAQR
ncbi:MAG: lysine--tRNA ligase, partial [bacterium]